MQSSNKPQIHKMKSALFTLLMLLNLSAMCQERNTNFVQVANDVYGYKTTSGCTGTCNLHDITSVGNTSSVDIFVNDGTFQTQYTKNGINIIYDSAFILQAAIQSAGYTNFIMLQYGFTTGFYMKLLPGPLTASRKYETPDNDGKLIAAIHGIGTPDGWVTATIGTMYINDAGGAGTTLYVKESGTGNTGWVGK